MTDCCHRAVTTYIVCTAYNFTGEHLGDEFARRMLFDAGISMNNKKDALVIESLGEQYVHVVKKLTNM